MDHSQPIETEAYARLERESTDWTTWEEKAQFFGEMKEFARKKGYKPGFAAMKFKDRFGLWPDDSRVKNAPEREMSTPTLLWLKCTQQDFWLQKKRPAR